MSLGFPVDRVLSLFPGSSNDLTSSTRLKLRMAIRIMASQDCTSTFPSTRRLPKTGFSGVGVVLVTLLDGRVAELEINHAGIVDPPPGGPAWPNVDNFITKLSVAIALPAARDWRRNREASKTLQCGGFDMEASVADGSGSIRLLQPVLTRAR